MSALIDDKGNRFEEVATLRGYRLMAHVRTRNDARPSNPDFGRVIPFGEEMVSAALFGDGPMPSDELVLCELAVHRAGCVGFAVGAEEWSALPAPEGGFVFVRQTAEVIPSEWNDPFHMTLKHWRRLVEEIADADSDAPMGEGGPERVVEAANGYLDGLRQLRTLVSDGMDRWMRALGAAKANPSIGAYLDVARGRDVADFDIHGLRDPITGKHALPPYAIGTMRRAGLALYPTKP